MLFKDQIDFVTQHIKKNKLRVFMTVLAATMGCAFLIVLASVGFGLQDSLRNNILSNEKVTKIQVFDNEPFTDEQIQEIKGVEHVESVLETITVNASAHSFFEGRDTSSTLYVANMQDFEQVNGKLSQGKYPSKPNEIIVGYHFAQTLLNDAERKIIEEKNKEAEVEGTYYDGKEEGYKDSLIGKEIELSLAPNISAAKETEKMNYTIVGVMKEPSYDWMINNAVYMDIEQKPVLASNLATAVDVKEDEMFYSEFNIFADTLENVKPILDSLKDKGYSVYSITEQLDQMNVFFLVLKIGLIFVGTIAVLIASIGIFNTMTMAVTERTREIGVLKAIGASPKLIQRLFLMESMFIGIVGTVIAVAISYAISFVANAVLPLILKAATGEDGFSNNDITFSLIPWQLVVIAAAISIGVAMISGYRPARKATKIDVIQALRQEL
ncbi:ABC transporter permease [Lysinibacillus pakistanensis]|uniref:ABC transporter permease n=1 Tax=Lysinibacillus pakistanensis TaxID=759811 RepID=A0AAX3WTT5_9BACI|nr:FtsX-like permease family protein [Lysinibacillus pakistanensis]MDM5230679.1 ABC transporter permease [Lysinibacillus pakistanensis]WHY46251.1 ABC transporter permease [Lysinibacillus pakistanensis]WHY51263.1 ABC transporter permease [Lysinibacillus pakistanensis]